MSRLFKSRYSNWVNLAINLLALFCFSAVVYLLMYWIYTGSSLEALIWAKNYPVRYLGEVTTIFLVGTILYTAVRRVSVAMFASGFTACFYASVNYFKVFFRQEPLLPWDFHNVSMAVSTLPMISLRFPIEIILSAVFLVVVLIVALIIEKKWLKPAKIKLWLRFALPVGLTAITVLFVRYISFNEGFIQRNGIWINRFIQTDNYRDNGLISAFFRNFQFLNIEKPAGYSQKMIDEIVKDAAPTTGKPNTPNIIILMNESFTDPDLYKNVGYSEDITPFFHSLQQSCLNGYVMGNQYGGGTANSELEVLTGYSLSYMPPGSVPYQQYFNKNQPSYASYLKTKGYSTLAIHSYNKYFWNRATAYPHMGFDRFISDEDFDEDAETKRGFITDMEVSKEIIRQYEENKKTGSPLFIHAVTVQNHVEYKPDQYDREEEVQLTSNPFFGEQAGGFVTYLTGLKYADQALEYLVRYFDSLEDPTIIIFFGDHLAKIGSCGKVDFVTAGYLTGDNSPEETVSFYSTPYVVWDNYANRTATTLKPMSMYQLLPTVTTRYNLPRSAFFNYLSEQQKYFRGYAQSVYLDSEGKPVSQLSDEAKQKENAYIMLQYDNFIGKQYGNGKLTE